MLLFNMWEIPSEPRIPLKMFLISGVIILSAFANLFRANKLSYVDQFVMAYGGLRGAIAFSLVVLLDSDLFPEKNLMITSTVVVVYMTVFVMVGKNRGGNVCHLLMSWWV